MKAQSVKSNKNWVKQYFLVGGYSDAAILKCKQVPLSQIKYLEKCRTPPSSPRYQSQTNSYGVHKSTLRMSCQHPWWWRGRGGYLSVRYG